MHHDAWNQPGLDNIAASMAIWGYTEISSFKLLKAVQLSPVLHNHLMCVPNSRDFALSLIKEGNFIRFQSLAENKCVKTLKTSNLST